ncbi:cytochrome c oxidase subunit II [Anaplasmataceae bacterium AB001_6]|nr:cytochrome c oxidase subunit II [Anaplasmataceae bacterium AB001_6]
MKFLKSLHFFTTFFTTLFVVYFSNYAMLFSQPQKWQMNLQNPATDIMRDIHSFHNIILLLMFSVFFLVSAILVYIIVRFNSRINPIPSKRSHNTLLEIIWTVIPLILVILISIPSIKLLIKEEMIPEADMTIKVVGNQWYWSYNYPDHNNISFDSYMIQDSDLKNGDVRLLSVDRELVVPTNKNIRVILTSSDVIHSWGVSALGVKMDAIPGMINETWFNINKPGKYYGQCYELCGSLHGFMPIVINAVDYDDFVEWIDNSQ